MMPFIRRAPASSGRIDKAMFVPRIARVRRQIVRIVPAPGRIRSLLEQAYTNKERSTAGLRIHVDAGVCPFGFRVVAFKFQEDC
jgi:hypothetical protein